MDIYNSAPTGIGASSNKIYSNKEPYQTISIIDNDGSYSESWESSLTIDKLGLLNPDNYIYGATAERIHNQQLYKARQGLGTNSYHDWLIIDGDAVGSREEKTFYRGRIDADGNWYGHRTRLKRGVRKETGPLLSGSDIRAIAKNSGNGVWYFPQCPYNLPKEENYKVTNVLTGEWDSKSKNPNDWKFLPALAEFKRLGFQPNSITNSGGKCDGFSPHAQWLFSTTYDKTNLLYMQRILQDLGADANVMGKRLSQFRKPGFKRNSKGKEQGLFNQHHDNLYDVKEWVEAAQLVGKNLGIKVTSIFEFAEELRVKEEAAKNSQPIDLSQFDGSDIERFLIEIDQQLPAYSAGNGTYQHRFIIAGAAKTLLGCAEKAKQLMPNCFSVNSIGWHSLRVNNNPIGTIINRLRLWFNNPQWQTMEWWRDKYRYTSNFTKGIKAAIANAIQRQIFKWEHEGDKFTGNPDDFFPYLKSLIDQDYIVLDRSGTGNGKTHRATHDAKLIFPNGRILIICPSPRKFPVKDADKKYTRVLGRNDKRWTQEGTELIPHEAHEAPSHAVKKFYCPLVDKITAIAAKGYQESIYRGDTSICKSCPFKKQCVTQPGWFKRDWRDAMKEGNDLIINPDAIPRDIGADNEHLYGFIDEVETTLNPYDVYSDSLAGLILAIEHYADTIGDNDVIPARKIIRALKPAFENKEAFGLDNDAVMDLLADVDLAGLSKLIAEIPKHFPDFTNIIQNDFFDVVSHSNKHKEKHSAIEAELTKEALKSLPSITLLYVLQAAMGDKSIYLSIQQGKLSATVHSPSKYHYLNRFKGLILMSATGNVADLTAELKLDKPIKAVWMGGDRPLSNLTIRAYRMTGIKSNRISRDKIKERLLLVKNHFGDMPCIAPKRWRLNVDSPHKESFLDADGHWMADSRGSNQFLGMPELLIFSLPKPHLGAMKARYQTANGSLDGFDDYYQRKQAQEAIQAVGRQRCQRYPDQQFTIHWVIDDYCDLNYLSELGATIIATPIAAIIPEAGSRWDIAYQSIQDAILKLKHDGINCSLNKIAAYLGRSKGSLSKLLKNHDVNLNDLISSIEQGFPSVNRDSINKGKHPETHTGKEFWEMWLWHLQADPGDILGDLAAVIESQGWTAYKSKFDVLPVELRAKNLAIIQAQLAMESELIA